jgi:hypothetical protein
MKTYAGGCSRVVIGEMNKTPHPVRLRDDGPSSHVVVTHVNWGLIPILCRAKREERQKTKKQREVRRHGGVGGEQKTKKTGGRLFS